jgi:hypothetical protein
MAQVRFKNKNTGELSTVASGGSAQDIIASKDPNYWEVVGEMPSITTKPVGLISTKDSINQVNKDVGKFQSMTGTSLNSPAVQGLLSNVATKLKATLPAEQPTQEKTQPVENKNAYSLEDAYSLWGGDFSGLTQNQDGTYTPDKTAISRLGITGLKTNEEDTTQKTLEGAVSSVNTQIQSLTSDLVNYNVDNDPEYQSAANSIRQQYEKLRQNMLQANEQRAGALKTLGYRTGAQQYAGSVQMGIEGEELTQANERMSEIARQENDAIAAARSAYKSGQYAEFNAKINALENIRQTKAEELNNYNNLLVEKNKAVAEQNKFNLEVLKYQQSQKTEKIKEFEYAKSQGFKGDLLAYQAFEEQIKQNFNPKDNTLVVGDNLLQYNEKTGGWDTIFTKPKDIENPTISEQISMLDKGITIDENGNLVKSTTNEPSYRSQLAVQGTQAVDGLLKIAKANPGIFGKTAIMPIPDYLRSDAFRNYRAQLDYLKGNIIPASLAAMREASKTGGALGQVSDKEGSWLASSLGALEMSQSPETVKKQLGLIKESLNRWNDAVIKNGGIDYKLEVQNGINNGTIDQTTMIKAIDDWNARGIQWDDSDLYNLFIGGEQDFKSGTAPQTVTKIKIGSPLAMRLNNPGNLRYIGQKGATSDNSGFAKFSSPQAGFQALVDDLNAKKDPYGRLNSNSTLADLINVYAPPSENATSTYIKQIASWLGVSPETKIGKIDTIKLAKAIAKKESSTIIT